MAKLTGNEQKLFQALEAVRYKFVMEGLADISQGKDVAYEAGRRIGARQGMDLMLHALNNYYTEEAAQDKEM